MTDTISNFDENCQPIFHFSPRTLVELSSMKIALDIWLQKFKEFYPARNTSYIDIDNLDINFELPTKVPQKIRKLIDAGFHPLPKQLDRWVTYSENVSNNLSYHHLYSRLDLVSFGGDGSVNFGNTVANFFNDDSLENAAKFEMACVYCVEEMIDFLWPLVNHMLSVDFLLFHNNFMLYYWICRKRGELNRIHLQGFARVEYLMIDLCFSLGNWRAVKYFLSLLDPNDRLLQINQFFEFGDSFEFTTNLLPFLSAPIQRHVVNLHSTNVLVAFVEHGDSFDRTIQVWHCIKNFLTEEQFYHDVIRRLIHFKNYDGIGSIFENLYVESVLTEIWCTSPQNLKRFILNYHFQNVLNQMATYQNNLLRNSSRDISFALAILSNADIHIRKTYWDENWSKWIAGVPNAQLDQLFNLCLSKNEIIDEFKRQLKDTEPFVKYCHKLIDQEYSTELNNFLSYLYPDSQEVIDIKMKLLKTNDHWKNVIFNSRDVGEIHNFVELIDKILSDDILAQDFKNQFILNEDNFKNLCNRLAEGSFLDIKNIVENFVSPEKQIEFKETLLGMFRDMVTNGGLFCFNEIDCRIFLMWCVENDEQRMNYFVKSLPIDEIFETAFSNCLKYNPNTVYGLDNLAKTCRFNDLNAFLRWYFESNYLRENFKCAKVQHYGKMLEADVRSIFSMDKEYVVETMKKELFFDGSNEYRAAATNNSRIIWRDFPFDIPDIMD